MIRTGLVIFLVAIGWLNLLADEMLAVFIPDKENMTPTNVYSDPIILTGDVPGQTWRLVGFSNNNNKWSSHYLRCFSNVEGQIVDATITTGFPIHGNVERVEIDAFLTSAPAGDNRIVSMTLQTCSDPSFETIDSEYPFDYSDLPEGAQSSAKIICHVDRPASGKYYRIFIGKNAPTQRGWFSIDSIRYFGSAPLGALDTPSIDIDYEPIYYDLTGNRLGRNTPALPGLYFIRRGSKTEKVLIQ
ncbi:MAG: hypothetical protein K2K79_02535 [Paramuribaculum sp.]|nr:hypothetical protein [Paramuribaculum sp.]